MIDRAIVFTQSYTSSLCADYWIVDQSSTLHSYAILHHSHTSLSYHTIYSLPIYPTRISIAYPRVHSSGIRKRYIHHAVYTLYIHSSLIVSYKEAEYLTMITHELYTAAPTPNLPHIHTAPTYHTSTPVSVHTTPRE